MSSLTTGLHNEEIYRLTKLGVQSVGVSFKRQLYWVVMPSCVYEPYLHIHRKAKPRGSQWHWQLLTSHLSTTISSRREGGLQKPGPIFQETCKLKSIPRKGDTIALRQGFSPSGLLGFGLYPNVLCCGRLSCVWRDVLQYPSPLSSRWLPPCCDNPKYPLALPDIPGVQCHFQLRITL